MIQIHILVFYNYNMASVLRNPQKLVNSGIFSCSLVTYPDGSNRTTDIDAISEKFGFFEIFESKEFLNDEIRIPLAQYTLFSEMYAGLKRSEVFFVGTDDYSRVYPEDVIWYTTMTHIEKGKVKTVNAPDVHIHRSQMKALPRADFCEFLSQLLEYYADPNYDVRTHVAFPEIKVRKF